MYINKIILKNINILSNVKEFAEEFAEIIIQNLMDLYFKYDQIPLKERNRNLTVFQIFLELLRNYILPQKTTNSVAQFIRVINVIFEDLIPEKVRAFVDNIKINFQLIIGFFNYIVIKKFNNLRAGSRLTF